jgi:hypothetical protein
MSSAIIQLFILGITLLGLITICVRAIFQILLKRQQTAETTAVEGEYED